MMDGPTAQIDIVVEVFGRLGVPTRKERLGGRGGGLCTFSGRMVLFVDLDADAATQLERILLDLAAMPEIDAVYLPPALRERIDQLKP